MYTPEICHGCPVIAHLKKLGVPGVLIQCEPTPEEKKFGSNGHDLADVIATDGRDTILYFAEKIPCLVLKREEE